MYKNTITYAYVPVYSIYTYNDQNIRVVITLCDQGSGTV